MDALSLSALPRALPIHAEEGSFREAISETELLGCVVDSAHEELGKGALQLVRRLFETLSLLDTRELELGNWAFVSFPAYLFGKSLLESLATTGQTLFDAGYWQQTGLAQARIIEEQRDLLAILEERRIRFHPSRDAAPIRFVYVAWGLIRLGRDFLLVHREDKTRRDAKNYVFPGGRLNLHDLPQGKRNTQSLRALNESDLGLAEQGLRNTLERELFEELALRWGTDYHAIFRQSLKPYRKLEGALNNHAFTQYQIDLYTIKLTSQGEARLLDEVTRTERLEWFSLGDIASLHGRPDGKVAFIDALHNEFSDALPGFLEDIPDSSGTPYRIFGEANAVDIPVNPDMPFRVGKTGKEKDRPISLDSDQLALLCTLVAHTRGIKLVPDEHRLKLLGGGWVRLASERSMQVAQNLTNKLASSGLPLIQLVADTYARIAIDPSIVYFNESAFLCRLDGYRFHLSLRLPTAPWADNVRVEKSLTLDTTLKLAISTIQSEGRLWNSDKMLEGKDFERELREKLDKNLRLVGLRKLVRTNLDDYVIAVPSADRAA